MALSVATPMTRNPLGPINSRRAMKSGICFLHWEHQVAQKLKTTTWPVKVSCRNTPPPTAGSSHAGCSAKGSKSRASLRSPPSGEESAARE